MDNEQIKQALQSGLIERTRIALRATEAKPSVSAAPGIKTWQERETLRPDFDTRGVPVRDRAVAAMNYFVAYRDQCKDEEIADLRARLDVYRLLANDWAGAAYNGLQWLKNIKDDIPCLDEAIENMTKCVTSMAERWPAAAPQPQAKARQQPPAGEDAIVAAVHAASATGRIALTVTGPDGIERPTNVATCFVRALDRAAK